MRMHVVTQDFFAYSAQISSLIHFLRNGKMTTNDWKEFIHIFSGMS